MSAIDPRQALSTDIVIAAVSGHPGGVSADELIKELAQTSNLHPDTCAHMIQRALDRSDIALGKGLRLYPTHPARARVIA